MVAVEHTVMMSGSKSEFGVETTQWYFTNHRHEVFDCEQSTKVSPQLLCQ